MPRFTRVALVAVSFIALNALVATVVIPWAYSLPRQSETSVTAAFDPTQPLIPVRPLPALSVLDQLINAAPAQGSWEQTGVVSAASAPLLTGDRCTRADSPTPVAARSQSYALPGVQRSRADVEVRSYAAGLGAAATHALRDHVKTCVGLELSGADLGFATESFTIDNIAARASSARTLILRVGDLVGIITVHGPKLTDANLWGPAWYQTWAEIVTVDVCPGQNSTLADAARTPASKRYAGGWKHIETVALDPIRAAAADRAGHALVRNVAPPTTNILALPETALKPTKLLKLAIYPKTLPVKLPTGRPAEPVAPVFPDAPAVTATTTTSITRDPIGPGCGWILNGQVAPPFTDSNAASDSVAAQADALADLGQARSDWWVDRYRYTQAFTTFTAQAARWNAWVRSTEPTIAAGWWVAYDAATIAYAEQQVVYVEAYAAWSAGKAANPPEAPTLPVLPAMPRPAS